MAPVTSIRWFRDIRLDDVALVGGKNASLGELYSVLSEQGVRVPNGFALTADAYRNALTEAGAWERLHPLLDSIDKTQIDVLARCAAEARAIVFDATGTDRLGQEIADSYRQLENDYGANVAVAVRSSATAEDLPTASFAGQHESFLNVRGANDLFEGCRRCFASIFTDRAISYRIDNGFDHFKVALFGVMKMVRADRASSGVAFTLDTESGFRDVVFITGVNGLGENIVQGTVDPDEFYVNKEMVGPLLTQNRFRPDAWEAYLRQTKLISRTDRSGRAPSRRTRRGPHRAGSARAGSATPSGPGHCRAVEGEAAHAARRC